MQWRIYELGCKTATVTAREHKHREKLIFLIYPMLCMATAQGDLAYNLCSVWKTR